MIDLSKVEAIIAEAEKPPIPGFGNITTKINALSEDERRDLAGIVYFGNGEYVTFAVAYQEAQKILPHPFNVAGELVALMGPKGLANALRRGLALLVRQTETDRPASAV